MSEAKPEEERPRYVLPEGCKDLIDAFQEEPTKKMMYCFDSDENSLGPPQEIPEPETIPNGLSAIPGYASRLVNSTGSFTSLMVTTLDGTGGCGLTRRDGETQIFLPIDWHQHPEQERCIRELFASHDIEPAHDYLAQNGGVPDATHILMYPLPDSSETIASLCTDLLASCFGISARDTLHFTFEAR